MNIVERARVYATAAHAAVEQVRKISGEPYIVHPARVSKTIKELDGTTEAMEAAAYLHDVVEDTGCTLDNVRVEFGDEVADLVDWLTDVSKPEDGNRKLRKAMDCEHTSRAPAQAQTIKLADIIDNSKSYNDPKDGFARRWNKEKEAQLQVLVRGDNTLRAIARAQLDEFMRLDNLMYKKG